MTPRQIAIQKRDRFYEGTPCEEGHTKRYTLGRRCVVCKKIREKKWRDDPTNTKTIRKNFIEWYHKNKKYHNDKCNEAIKKKYKEDSTYRCFKLLGRSLRYFLKKVGTIKEDRTHEIVGYSPRKYHDHLESLFQEGMTWDNQGKDGWEIDHIRPSSWFTKEQSKECFALSNLKPEWAEWNAWKSNRFEGSSEEYPMPKKVIKK
jgi:hypothetical protein